MAKLEAVLWDFGGVFSPSPFSALAALGREKGLEEGHYFEAIFGPYDGDTDHPWHRLERGEIDFVSAREAIMQGARPAASKRTRSSSSRAWARAGACART